MPIAADIAGELVEALSFAFGMFWEILWALILGGRSTPRPATRGSR